MSIYNALKEYENLQTRFHMPGHGGLDSKDILKELDSILPFDVTETSLTDNLYDPKAFIKQSERKITDFYGTKASVISAGGATLCINTALMLAGGQGNTIAVDRRCHKSVYNTMVLLDQKPVYIYPDAEKNSVLNYIDPGKLESLLKEKPNISCIIVTSPTYYGIISNIKEISKVCHKYNSLLVVDNAHGSHLILDKNLHPLFNGADIVIDSLHKTLPALTGAALLHSQRFSSEELKSAMSLFGSSSPSYLISMSADLCTDYLISGKATVDFNEVKTYIEEVGQYVESHSKVSVICGGKESRNNSFYLDPWRLTLDFNMTQLSAETASDALLKKGISIEFADNRYMVLIIPPKTNRESLKYFGRQLCTILNKLPESPKNKEIPDLRFEQVLSPRAAYFSPIKKEIPLNESLDRICGKAVIPYPPGIPLISPGEKITREFIEYCKGTIDKITIIEEG
ncbi:MAG: aminotransferase class I/II-fold pyridoxal phosphate-dependent enzyme [Bacillota bacterium]|nr:aminotransferase class I/II-fold pyridoxal phosphate-dependent enzyme [Bacillota bacterium]